MKYSDACKKKIINATAEHCGQHFFYPQHFLNLTKYLVKHIAPYFFDFDKSNEKDFKLLKEGAVTTLNRDKCLDANYFYMVASLLKNNFTLVLNHIEKKSPLFFELFEELFDNRDILSHFNLYWSPAGSVGAGLHDDDHDVFVVQLVGEKIWHVDQTTYHLTTGDMLYVARGVLHNPVTLETAQSLHLTIGIVPVNGKEKYFSRPSTHYSDETIQASCDFVKSMGVLANSKKFALTLNPSVHLNWSSGVMVLRSHGGEFSLNSEIFGVIFSYDADRHRLNFRHGVQKHYMLSVVLSLYKASIPFLIDEADAYA